MQEGRKAAARGRRRDCPLSQCRELLQLGAGVTARRPPRGNEPWRAQDTGNGPRWETMAGSSKKLRLAVLVSGGGSNLQSLIDRSAAGELAGEVVVVVSDRPDAHGLVRAEEANIPRFVVDYRSHGKADPRSVQEQDPTFLLEDLDRAQKILREPDREKRLLRLSRLVSAERELISILDRFQPDLVCLAGYMRLVTPFF
ncbi:MAG: hypothetical protein HGA63_10910, partial [Syntrophobacteraceae bacterium]|nr:hypothetical protein [Syntrophobacteraceae bacterium]